MLAPPLAAAFPFSAFRPRRALHASARGSGEREGGRSAARRSTVLALLALVVSLDVLAGGPRVRRPPAAPDPAPPLATLLGRAPSAPASSAATPAPLDAYLVTSARDCASNLGALDLLAREAIAPRIRLAAALVVQPRQHPDARAPLADSTALRSVREAIAARGLTVPTVRALDPATALLLRRIGYRSTPFLVVLDSAGTLRFATPPSLSFAEYHHLANSLAAIAGDVR